MRSTPRVAEVEKSKFTQKFLQTLSQHLSSREECKGLTYRIAIGVYDDKVFPTQISMFEEELRHKRVCFFPNVLVFPDRHHRKETDKVNVVTHVARDHYDDLLCTYQEEGCVFVQTDNLVKGVYEYQPSVDHKKRRWVRLESL